MEKMGPYERGPADNRADKSFLPEELQNKLRSYITERSGLYFKDHELRNLNEAVFSRMKTCNINSALAYYSFLTSSAQKENEIRELLNLLTVNHTYFFRDEPQFKVLKEKVLPEIIRNKSVRASEKHSKPSLRIWSAGCSTGEEPYTIAILIKELIPNIGDWDILILATDASEQALAGARKGIYSGISVKHTEKAYLEKYFSEVKKQGQDPATYTAWASYALSTDIKGMVNFAFFNLISDEYPQSFDVIFCRNVVIYFEFETILKVMGRLHTSLLDGGYIFIGYSETLQYMRDKFQMESASDAIYYRKLLQGEAPSSGAKVKPLSLKAEEKIDIDKILEEISKAELAAQKISNAKKDKIDPRKFEEILVKAVKTTHRKEYVKALALFKEAQTLDNDAPEPRYYEAEIFLSRGETKEAKDKLVRLLEEKPLFCPAHYLLGCIYLNENELDKAKKSLRKALYIDRDFLLANFYLAQAFRNENNISYAIREYRNTISLLSKHGSNDILAYSGGFNTATLTSVCRDNLERLKTVQ
ncbi:MAG: tetratricopeptide repeat protein [Candidatus Omnitrophica bacterium]|nr:tetratricopeptide repeat protein [Candidatus Omnitrophota bacterium]